MKPSQLPFFFRSILTSLTICVALCFTGVSSFGGTLTTGSVSERSLAEQSVTDDLGSPNQSLTFNVSGLASQMTGNRTGATDHQFLSGQKTFAESLAHALIPPSPNLRTWPCLDPDYAQSHWYCAANPATIAERFFPFFRAKAAKAQTELAGPVWAFAFLLERFRQRTAFGADGVELK